MNYGDLYLIQIFLYPLISWSFFRFIFFYPSCSFCTFFDTFWNFKYFGLWKYIYCQNWCTKYGTVIVCSPFWKNIWQVRWVLRLLSWLDISAYTGFPVPCCALLSIDQYFRQAIYLHSLESVLLVAKYQPLWYKVPYNLCVFILEDVDTWRIFAFHLVHQLFLKLAEMYRKDTVRKYLNLYENIYLGIIIKGTKLISQAALGLHLLL